MLVLGIEPRSSGKEAILMLSHLSNNFVFVIKIHMHMHTKYIHSLYVYIYVCEGGPQCPSATVPQRVAKDNVRCPHFHPGSSLTSLLFHSTHQARWLQLFGPFPSLPPICT